MGMRIGFYSHPTFTIKELLIQEYTSFRNWYLASEKEFSGDLNQQIKDFLKSHSEINIDNLDQKTTDQLVGNFIGFYCDISAQDLLTLHNPLLSPYKYEDDSFLVRDRCSNDAFILWQYLFKGRSIINKDKPFEPMDEEELFKVGYWTKEEKIYLLDQLKLSFKKKEDFSKRLNCTGVEAIIQVLEGTVKISNELILTIG
jgi:RNA recognition motif-containing protein